MTRGLNSVSIQPQLDKGAWLGPDLAVLGDGCDPVPTCPAGLKILAVGRGGSIVTIPLLPNVMTCEEPCRLHFKAPHAAFGLQASSEHPYNISFTPVGFF